MNEWLAPVDPRGQVMMVPLTAADLDRMAELVETYGDFPLGLVDASVIAVAERLERGRGRHLGSPALFGSAAQAPASVQAPA